MLDDADLICLAPSLVGRWHRTNSRRSASVGFRGALHPGYSGSSFIRSTARTAALDPSSLGFTLTELLVVISIIVLLLALAVPALKVLGGGRDIASGENQIAAILGRGRAQAIADRTVAGVMFFLDPKDSRVKAAIVEESPATITLPSIVTFNPPPGGTISLELATDALSGGNVISGNPVADIFLMPPGVGVQVLDDCVVDTTTNPPTRRDDGYLGFNTRNQYKPGSDRTYAPTMTPPTLGVEYGGVILFDASGKLVAKSYVFDAVEPDPITPGQFDFTMLGQLLYGASQYDRPGTNSVANYSNDQYVTSTPATPPSPAARVSQFGLVVFDHDAFIARGFTDKDAEAEAPNAGAIYGEYTAGWNPSEATEETWLDQNSTPLIIDRYSGSLIRGE